MSWEQPGNPRDVPPEEVVDRCPKCGAPMELVVSNLFVFERCDVRHHVAHRQTVFPEAFAEG